MNKRSRNAVLNLFSLLSEPRFKGGLLLREVPCHSGAKQNEVYVAITRAEIILNVLKFRNTAVELQCANFSVF